MVVDKGMPITTVTKPAAAVVPLIFVLVELP